MMSRLLLLSINMPPVTPSDSLFIILLIFSYHHYQYSLLLLSLQKLLLFFIFSNKRLMMQNQQQICFDSQYFNTAYNTMSDSDLSSSKQKQLKRQRSNKSNIVRQNRFVPAQPPKIQLLPKQVVEDQTGLQQQNKKLRRKLKELSIRLDEELQKAAENKLKHKSDKNGHPVSLQSHSLQLQNAYKMIQRLQKAVKDYQSKQSYQVTLKRVMDLQGIIKKKQSQVEDLKTEVKTLKKMTKDKEKHIEELIENSKKMGNPTQDLQTINKLKAKIKKITQDNELLRRKQLEKHQKMIKAERRVIQLEQSDREIPIANDQNLVNQLQQYKNKYKQAKQRIDRQNIYISKLNQKLNRTPPIQRDRKSQRQSERHSQRKNISLSMQQLPQLKKNKLNPINLLQHLPSPKISKLKRY